MSKRYSKSTIESLIKTLDNKLKEKVEVIAIGGTALSLLGGRAYSKDIDICYGNCSSPSDFAQTVVDSAKDIGIDPVDVEMFCGFEMTLLEIPRFSENAIPYRKIYLKNVDFKIMNPTDIALSKIYRGEPRDIKDVKNLLDDRIVGLSELRNRFIEIVKNQKDMEIRKEFIKKYESFLEAYHKNSS